MNFLEKLDDLMAQNNLNKHSLSKASGIPYTTIDAFYKKGYDNAKLSTLKKLAHQFNTTIDYLMRDEILDIDFGIKKAPPSKDESVSEEAMQIAKAYDDAILKDKNTVRVALGFPLIKEEASNTGKMA